MGHRWAELQDIAASDATCCKSFSNIHPVATGLSCRLLSNQLLIRLYHILAAVFYVYSILITVIDTEAEFEWNVSSRLNWILRERRTLLLSLYTFWATKKCFWTFHFFRMTERPHSTESGCLPPALRFIPCSLAECSTRLTGEQAVCLPLEARILLCCYMRGDAEMFLNWFKPAGVRICRTLHLHDKQQHYTEHPWSS